MKKFIIVLTLLSLSVMIFAQDLAQDKDFKNGLGFAAGMSSGSGFSFAHKFDKSAYQITFGILATNSDNECYQREGEILKVYDDSIIDTTNIWTDECDGSYLSANAGIQYLWYLHKAKKSAFFLTFETAIYYSSTNYTKQNYRYAQIDTTNYQVIKVGDKYNETEKSIHINPGIGIGAEIKITKNIVGSIGLPLTYSYSKNSKYRIYMLVPQVSLMYFF